MADVLLNEPLQLETGQSRPTSGKKRLNWLAWMRNSIGSRGFGNKLCSCDHHQREHHHLRPHHEAAGEDGGVFTTQTGKTKFILLFFRKYIRVE
jgi:hypothetical protein